MNQPGGECIRCGQCMSVCPVFQATRMEADVARGRLSVLKAARIDLHSLRRGVVPDVLSRCLQCGACEQTCANKVPVIRNVVQAKAQGKSGIAKRLQLAALTQDNAPAGVLRQGGRLAQGLLGRAIDQTSGLRLRFPASFFTSRQVIPALAPVSWMARHKAPAKQGPGPRVGFFVGCGTNHLFQDQARALERLAEIAGFTLVTVPGQGCCGLPYYSAGDMDSALACAQRNLEAFAAHGLDAVVTVCASCGSHLVKYAEVAGPDSPLHEQAVKLAGMHQDAARYLLASPKLMEALRSANQRTAAKERPRVYYHAPCHLRFGPAADNAPMDLLSLLDRRLDLIPTADLVHCCGHGGGFNIDHHELSMEIHQACLAPILEAGPRMVVTGCTGCRMQFLEGVHRSGALNLEVNHPLVLVERALLEQ